MNLGKEMLTALLGGLIKVELPLSNDEIMAMFNDVRYVALKKIQAIIQDNTPDDFECVERIVSVYEEIGSNGGERHDFG